MVSMRLLFASLILLAAPLAALPADAAPTVPEVRPTHCPDDQQGVRVDVDGRRVVDCTPPLLWPCDDGVAVMGVCIQYGRSIVLPVRADAAGPVELNQCPGRGNSVTLLDRYTTPCIYLGCDPACRSTTAKPEVRFGPCPEGQGMTVDVNGKRVQDCQPPVVDRCDGFVSVAGQCIRVNTTASQPVDVGPCRFSGHDPGVYVRVLGASTCIPVPRV